MQGRVIRTTGSWHDVQVGDDIVPSRVRGKFRLNEQEATNPVAVGDWVTIEGAEDDTGVITAIHERENRLSRRAAGRRAGLEHVIVANIDQAWAVQAVRFPKLNPGFIDRFLVMAEVDEIPPALIFNKIDLLETARQREETAFWETLYTSLGYPVLRVSAVTGEGIDLLREHMYEQTSVFAGPSGVGKSSLLNAIEPGLDLRTGDVSQKTRKGRHTTTFAQLLPLSEGGYIVDTPGIREFGIWDLQPEELSFYFVEMRSWMEDCRFPNCTHDHEPGCAVKAAVADDEISTERYNSYLNILESLRGEDVGR